MEEDYGFDPYMDAADDASVGSLAYVATPSASIRRSKTTRKGGATSDDDSQDSTSPENLVRKQTRGFLCYKRIIIVLTVAGGTFLSISTYRHSDLNDAAISTGIVAGFFVAILLAFWRYDVLVNRRNKFILDIAKRSRNIVDELFPGGFRDRLLNQDQSTERRGSKTNSGTDGADDPFPITDFAKLTRMNTLANQQTHSELVNTSGKGSTVKIVLKANGDKKLIAQMVQNSTKDQPMAELFSNTTVLFADIAGFTAWSSERDPPAVFTLLETAYAAFDDMAEKLKVFKVETIGDCYMCVTGLPEPDENHAVNMARFAYQIVTKMESICLELEGKLGPGTEVLAMRVGCHSGPVTAGVLRNQKSRFQLFGDTVNTASRMESTGQKGCIQVSEDTAVLLKQAGKAHWVQERLDRVQAKGKGKMQTYWLDPRNGRGGEVRSAISSDDEGPNVDESDNVQQALPPRQSRIRRHNTLANSRRPFTARDPSIAKISNIMTDDRKNRLIDWTADVLLHHLENVVKCRVAPNSATTKSIKTVDYSKETGELPPIFDSVTEILSMPKFDPYAVRRCHDELPGGALEGLREVVREFVSEIANLYNDNSFHCFEHAGHVTLAMDKLIARMSSTAQTDQELHERTFGLSSDFISRFALVFAAFIHDVGHPGVTNAQLIAEDDPMARKFNDKSIVEQHSFEIAWRVLMKPRYRVFREQIYCTNAERKRFRQVLINAVMATDISDRSLLQQRALRWEKAFKKVDSDHMHTSQESGRNRVTRDADNRKATVVIDTLMQLADVAHTLQHWNIYRKWNEKLFNEVMLAWKHGRMSVSPMKEGMWYKGDLAFFDYFVIPLAQRLLECGIFGSSGSQYLAFAIANKKQWEQVGPESVSRMIGSFKTMHDKELSEADNDANTIEQMVLLTMGRVTEEKSCEKSIVELVVEQLVTRQSTKRMKSNVATDIDFNTSSKEWVSKDPLRGSGVESSAFTYGDSVASVALTSMGDENLVIRGDISNASSL
ncbi:hypothetical protein MPSEU_001028800 [Mayamaea pseudoterrestris]|nr:hypothetical protein MPSEU_001028800 [Mayamaea pseudoterrestris]